jgi:hypothetical protein
MIGPAGPGADDAALRASLLHSHDPRSFAPRERYNGTLERFHSGTYRARLRHTWGVNLPVFFPMPEGREFSDPPRCAFCDELGRPIRPDPPETADLPRLVAGPGLFICERCVRLCTEILEEDDLTAGD